MDFENTVVKFGEAVLSLPLFFFAIIFTLWYLILSEKYIEEEKENFSEEVILKAIEKMETSENKKLDTIIEILANLKK